MPYEKDGVQYARKTGTRQAVWDGTAMQTASGIVKSGLLLNKRDIHPLMELLLSKKTTVVEVKPTAVKKKKPPDGARNHKRKI